MASNTIREQQARWARRAGWIPTEGYLTLKENFFTPLSALSVRDLSCGDGGELVTKNGRCKAEALHSSATLACNFFDYWRGRDLSALAEVFGTEALCGLQFEVKFPTGFRGKAPNLDVVLFGRSGSILGIESKFTEPFHGSKLKGFLKPKYFERPDTWATVGLPGCQHLADDLRRDPNQFKLLDAAQLLKHMLGLASSGSPWRLCCLWYRPVGEAGDRHATELARFIARIGDDASRFSELSYQEAFRRLVVRLGSGDEAYRNYLADRYFNDAG